MAISGKEVIFAVVDNYAAHNLIQFVSDTEEDRIRLIAGATMAGVGFTIGPELEERLRDVSDGDLTPESRRQLTYAAGGVVLGGVIGYLAGPDIHRMKSRHYENGRLKTVAEAADVSRPGFDWQHPGTLLTLGSAAWLGYSLLKRPQTEEMRKRQIFGLGAGALGWLAGPEAIRQIKRITLPEEAYAQTREIYSRGTALFSAIAGGAIGWYTGRTEDAEAPR